jgi:hypothetical protein
MLHLVLHDVLEGIWAVFAAAVPETGTASGMARAQV